MGFRVTNKPFSGGGAVDVYSESAAKQETSPLPDDTQATFQRLVEMQRTQQTFQRLLEMQRLQTRVSELSGKLAAFESDFDGLADPTETTVSREQRMEIVNNLLTKIPEITSFIEGLAGEQEIEIAAIRIQAEVLRTQMQERLIAAIRVEIDLRESADYLRGQKPKMEALPLTDGQIERLQHYIDLRIAELEGGGSAESTVLADTLSFVGIPDNYSDQGVVVFMQRYLAAEEEAMSRLESEWEKLSTLGQQITAGFLQARSRCGQAGSADLSAVDEARRDAAMSVAIGYAAAERIPVDVLLEHGLLHPVNENIMELPYGARICDQDETDSGPSSATFVYLDEFEDASRPRDREEFMTVVRDASGEAFARLIRYMRDLNSACAAQSGGDCSALDIPESLEVGLQLYINDDGRIRTIAVTYEDQPENAASIYQNFAQNLTENISREVKAPSNMQYYRMTLMFEIIDENRVRVNVAENR